MAAFLFSRPPWDLVGPSNLTKKKARVLRVVDDPRRGSSALLIMSACLKEASRIGREERQEQESKEVSDKEAQKVSGKIQ